MGYLGTHPIGVKRGGTADSSLTTYQPLCGGTTSTGALQQVAAGTSGYMLQSNGASALPSFVSSNTVGSWVLLNYQVISSGATIPYTSLISNAYTTYVLLFTSLNKSNTTTVNIQVSTNNGSSYINSGYTGGSTKYVYNSTTVANTNSSSSIILLSSFAASTSSGGIIYFRNVGNGGQFTWDGQTVNGASTTFGYDIISGSNTATTVNAFQLFPGAGTFSNGYLSFYGVVQ